MERGADALQDPFGSVLSGVEGCYSKRVKPLRRIAGSLLSMPLVRDIVTLQIGSVINIVLTLASSVVYARLLGVSGFGQYAVALAFSGTVSALCNLGQASALTTFLSEQHGRRDRQGMGYVISYYLSVSGFFAFILLVIAWKAPAIYGAFYGDSSLGFLGRLAILNVILNLIPGLFLPVFQTVREMRTYVAFDQGITALELILGVTLVILGRGPAGILEALIAVQVICIPFFLFRYHALSKKHVLPSLGQCLILDGKSWRGYLAQGVLIGVDKNVSNLFPNGLIAVLRVGSNDAVAGLARIVFQLALVPRLLLLTQSAQMAMTVLPAVAARGRKELRVAAVRLLKHTLFLHTLITVCCMIAMPYCVLLFYGVAYAPAIEPALWLMLISILPAFTLSNISLLRLLRRTWISTVVNLWGLLCSIGVFFTLIHLVPALTAMLCATFFYYLLQQVTTIIVYGKLLRRQPIEAAQVIDVPGAPL